MALHTYYLPEKLAASLTNARIEPRESRFAQGKTYFDIIVDQGPVGIASLLGADAEEAERLLGPIRDAINAGDTGLLKRMLDAIHDGTYEETLAAGGYGPAPPRMGA